MGRNKHACRHQRLPGVCKSFCGIGFARSANPVALTRVPLISGCGAQADICVDKVLERDEDRHVALVHLTGHADLLQTYWYIILSSAGAAPQTLPATR